MTIYEIKQEIQALIDSGVDEETGEALFDTEQLEKLEMERDQKVENLVCAIKNLTADSEALKKEEKSLADRRRTIDNKISRAKDYLAFVLNGEKFQSVRASVSYRKNTRLEVDADFVAWALEHDGSLIRMAEPEPDKAAIKARLKAGAEIPHTALIEEQSMIIK